MIFGMYARARCYFVFPSNMLKVAAFRGARRANGQRARAYALFFSQITSIYIQAGMLTNNEGRFDDYRFTPRTISRPAPKFLYRHRVRLFRYRFKGFFDLIFIFYGQYVTKAATYGR